jgi:hypothetical protein
MSIRISAKPEQPKEFMELLAEVNKRASEHFLYGETISAACHTVWIPPQDDESAGAQGKFFAWDKDHSIEAFVTPTILFGINAYHSERKVIELLSHNLNHGDSPPIQS